MNSYARILTFLGVAAVASAGVSSQPSWAADFHVAPDGSDEADGSSADAAFATIARGAAALANPGDRVIVAAGEYAEGDISPARGGGLGPPVEIVADREGTFTGRPGRVVVRPPSGVGTGFIVIGRTGVVIRGFDIVGGNDAGVQVRTARDGTDSGEIAVVDCAIVGSNRRGIDVLATGPVRLVGNYVADHATGGISVAGGEAGPVEPFVANNVLLDNGIEQNGHGLFVRDAVDGVIQNNQISGSGLTGVTIRNGERLQVANNLVFDSGVACGEGRICGHGFALGSGGEPVVDITLANNTAYGNFGWGVLVGNDAAPSRGAMLLNNILAENGLGGLAVSRESTCGYIAGFNLNPNGYGPDTPFNRYDLTGEPGFVDAASGDFRLSPAGSSGPSPAIDAGSAPASAIGLAGSAVAGSGGDSGTVDLGYHYGATADQVLNLERPLLPLYVRASGNDGANGASAPTALATVKTAAARAAAGVTVIVGPGVYPENNIGARPRSGVVVFYADSDGIATGDDPGVVLIDAGPDSPGFFLGSACEGVVDGFYVRGGESGIQVRNRSDRAWITNNVIFSAVNRGVDVVSSDDARITNNLIYGSNGGVQVDNARQTLVASNTIYGHRFNGVFVQGESPCTRVRYNIIEANQERGLLVRLLPQIVDWNLNSDNYLGIVRPDTDRSDLALLIDPAGGDGVVGGTGFADDWFALSPGSPARDLVPLDVEDTELADGSTEPNGEPDRGRLDAGFHAPVTARDPTNRPLSTALVNEDDAELCDALIAELDNGAGPGDGGNGNSGGGCNVVPPTGGAGGRAAIVLVIPLAVFWQIRRVAVRRQSR